MEIDKTVDENNEKNQEELDNSDESQKSTDGVSDEDKKLVEKKEQDPYEAKLKEVEYALEKEREINRQKTGALKERDRIIKEMKSKKTEYDDDFDLFDEEKDKEEKIDPSKFVSREEFERLQKENKQKEEFAEIKPKITSVSEGKLIKVYMEQGLSAKDAYLKANEHLIDKVKTEAKKRIDEENEILDMSGSQNYSGSKEPSYAKTPLGKKTAEFLDAIGASNAKKFIN